MLRFLGVFVHKNFKKLILARACPACGSLSGLVPSRWPVLSEAFVAVDGPALGRLEGNFTFLSAVRAGRLVHLPWSTVEAAPFAVIHSIHSFLLYIRPPYGSPNIRSDGVYYSPLNLCMFKGVIYATFSLFYVVVRVLFCRYAWGRMVATAISFRYFSGLHFLGLFPDILAMDVQRIS